MQKRKTIHIILISVILLVISVSSYSQNNDNIKAVISKIYELEKNKDPKCYATANRLEDFMYGIPLTETARNSKIEIQKELIYYLKQEASIIAKKQNLDKITVTQLEKVIQKISNIKKDAYGNFLYTLTTGTVKILKKDFNQYNSVSYGYRSLLSVEQDLLYFPENSLLDFSDDAIKVANDYVNLLTLVVLKVSDLKARKLNKPEITKELLINNWILVLSESENSDSILKTNYSNKLKNNITQRNKNDVLRAIIGQKIASYKNYNNLTESVFLRNLQVYFARQKWPVDKNTSEDLRSYYLESLILFASSLIEKANTFSKEKNSFFIRNPEVEKALYQFQPNSINQFEDVTFFPNNLNQKITIESYDLDSFRDSGFHWRILGYALDDLSKKDINTIDPIASELIVEGIAQMAVLVLRLAGIHSKENNKEVLDKKDIKAGFEKIQALIDSYHTFKSIKEQSKIKSANSSNSKKNSFIDVTKSTNLDFEHKSSDWLNRFIRSYSVAADEGKINLAIPPAFGGSGVACEDINNDGVLDILLLGGFGNKLFLGTSEKRFIDVSKKSNLNIWNDSLQSYGEPRQPIIADFDNDGKQDIIITYVNNEHQVYKNIDGIHFENVSSKAGLGGKNLVAGPATAFDYDNDGLLDIYIGYFGNYLKGKLPNLSRDSQNGTPNKLFKNFGNFVFREVSLSNEIATNSGWTQAVGHSDINQDGYQDIIVGNDFGVNKYYLNSKEGVFTEVSSKLKTDKPSYTMNIGITDLNKDLYPDFYISNIVVMQKDEKYVSPNRKTTMKFDPKKMANIRTVEANDLFISNTTNKELENYILSDKIGNGYSVTGWSWDADFFDFDNDGDEDLYCLNGMNDFSVYSTENPFYFERLDESKTIVYAESNREKNVLFVNNNGKLINEAEQYGLDLNSNARSASFFDYDRDGDLDILINNYHENAVLLENKNSNTNNWIRIKLVGNPEKNINKDAIGSTLIINGKTQKNIWREIHSTTGYLSVHPKEQHFGLGKEKSVNVIIKWSNGESFEIKGMETNQSYKIKYPNTIIN